MKEDSDKPGPDKPGDESSADERAEISAAIEALDLAKDDAQFAEALAEQRRNQIIVANSTAANTLDVREAIEALAGQLPNIRERLRFDLRARREWEALGRAEVILRALHFAIASSDDDGIGELHDAAVRYLRRRPTGDGRDAVRRRTGLNVQKKEHFGGAVVELLRNIPDDADDEPLLRLLADAECWKKAPFPKLRNLYFGHPLMTPKLKRWVDKEWRLRDTAKRGYLESLARSLLRALGVSDVGAENAIR